MKNGITISYTELGIGLGIALTAAKYVLGGQDYTELAKDVMMVSGTLLFAKVGYEGGKSLRQLVVGETPTEQLRTGNIPLKNK